VYSSYRFIAERLRKEKKISLSDVIFFHRTSGYSSAVSGSSINLL
jgi:hypothetical protein